MIILTGQPSEHSDVETWESDDGVRLEHQHCLSSNTAYA